MGVPLGNGKLEGIDPPVVHIFPCASIASEFTPLVGVRETAPEEYVTLPPRYVAKSRCVPEASSFATYPA